MFWLKRATSNIVSYRSTRPIQKLTFYNFNPMNDYHHGLGAIKNDKPIIASIKQNANDRRDDAFTAGNPLILIKM